MKFLIAERISANKYKTPEGYLVCVDSVLARTGKQTYRKNEIFVDCDDDTEIEVDRKPEEVFSEATLASFENKPITIEHPDEDVNTGNFKNLAVGFVRDIHRGKDNGQDVMLGTLVITDEEAISAVESGELLDLSCGYDCDIEDSANPQQRNIRGNHVALCENGRAGIARIVDSVIDNDELPEEEDSTFRYSGARGEEIFVTNYDGRNTFLVSGGKSRYNEKMMQRRDVERYLDEHGAKFSKVIDSIEDAKLPSNIKKNIQRVLSARSTFTSRDIDVSDVVKEIERYCKIDGTPVKLVRESIKGWFKTGDGMMRKDYVFAVEGYSNRILISMYANPDTWKTTEVNGYFIDSVDDAEFTNYNTLLRQALNDEVTAINIYDQILANKDTPEEVRNQIQEIENDEKDHYRILAELVGEDAENELKGFGDSMKDFYFKAIEKVGNYFSAYFIKATTQSEAEKLAKAHSTKYGHELASIEATSEREVETGKNRGMSVLGDSVKDSMYEITLSYTDNKQHDLHKVTVRAFTVTEAVKLAKEKANTPAVEVESIRFLDSCEVKDKLVELDLSDIAKIEQTFKSNKIFVKAKGKTWTGRVHYQVEYAGSARELKNKLDTLDRALDKLGIPMTYSISGNDDDTFATAGVDFDKKYVADSDVEDGKNAAENAVESAMKELGITKEQLSSKRKEVEMKISSKGLYGRTQAGWFVDDYIKNHVNDSNVDDEEEKVDDAIQTFEIRWIDTYKKSKGYVKEEYLHIDKIKANSLSEALKKLADNVALMGVGTMNAMVVSIHSDKTSYMYSGKLGELVRKVKDSSKIERAINAIRAMRKI